MTSLKRVSRFLRQAWLSLVMRSSADYWERRYLAGMTSGSGSEGRLARFKADILNEFVRDHDVATVIEFGCGDGSQLALAEYPRYLGLDVSPAAVALCRRRFAGDPTKTFRLLQEGGAPARSAELALSLDVIYHLLEDDVYREHLDALFGASDRWVIVYSSNSDSPAPARHVRHRRFSEDVRIRHREFSLVRRIGNAHPEDSFAEFYIFERSPAPVHSSRS